jgi:hypothetical protein
MLGAYDAQGPTLHVRLHNRGRAAISVASPQVRGLREILGKERGTVGWLIASLGDRETRIEGHSGQRWSFPAAELATTYLQGGYLTRLQVIVDRADGPQLILPVSTEDIDHLDPAHLPPWDPDYLQA